MLDRRNSLNASIFWSQRPPITLNLKIRPGEKRLRRQRAKRREREDPRHLFTHELSHARQWDHDRAWRFSVMKSRFTHRGIARQQWGAVSVSRSTCTGRLLSLKTSSRLVRPFWTSCMSVWLAQLVGGCTVHSPLSLQLRIRRLFYLLFG